MKSISRAVSAPHCVCVLRDRHKLHTLCKRKIAFELNNDRERRKRPARNQLLKLNIKNPEIIVCGKAICLQLGDLHISQSAEKGNRTLMEWQRLLRHFKIQPDPTFKKHAELISRSALTRAVVICPLRLHLLVSHIEGF